jgi:glycosyltransferase involved in cell wall biosynthesis
MQRAALFVHSSRWEGLPNVLIEALACGTPVVSTNTPYGPDEILEGGRWGRLTPVGDAEAMARAMLDSLNGGTLAPEVLQRRAEDFSPERSVAAYDALFTRLIRRNAEKVTADQV